MDKRACLSCKPLFHSIGDIGVGELQQVLRLKDLGANARLALAGAAAVLASDVVQAQLLLPASRTARKTANTYGDSS